MTSRLDLESEKIIKSCSLERQTISNATTRAYKLSSALKILILFGSLTDSSRLHSCYNGVRPRKVLSL